MVLTASSPSLIRSHGVIAPSAFGDDRKAPGPRPGGCAIAVMAKASWPGRTKTRLVPPLTFDEAARFNTTFLQDAAANIFLAGRFADVTPFMAFGPPGTAPFVRNCLPAGVGLVGSAV